MNRPALVIIPAYNEEASIARVIRDVPAEWVREVVVVNNNSTDATVERATEAGATVLTETQKGYGFACLRGIAYAASLPPDRLPSIIVFLDGDYSDFPGEMETLLLPIRDEGYDMVIGSRVTGNRQKGSLTPQQVFGNWLATRLLRLFYGVRFTDLGPFRAIRLDKLLELKMRDTTFGWTVEMQVKAAKKKYRVIEKPVSYRKRIGVSKISGTIKGSIKAGFKIIFTIFRYL